MYLCASVYIVVIVRVVGSNFLSLLLIQLSMNTEAKLQNRSAHFSTNKEK